MSRSTYHAARHPHAFAFERCYARNDDGRVFETYWTADRGTEVALWSYGLMDLTVFGRQERWEDGPAGWPRVPEGEHSWRVDGRPTAQWAVTDDDAAEPQESRHH